MRGNYLLLGSKIDWCLVLRRASACLVCVSQRNGTDCRKAFEQRFEFGAPKKCEVIARTAEDGEGQRADAYLEPFPFCTFSVTLATVAFLFRRKEAI